MNTRQRPRSRGANKAVMLVTTGLCSGLMAGSALAQAAAPQSDSATGLQEVVVTATRQSDTVNRVPLAITAETQKSMDQKGIRSIADLTATVPALSVSQLSPGVAQITIRGILSPGTGAPTTGFYLDDTPLQKRAVGGGVATNNGTPLPPLFDLERVEVLRGPQGTLYGGSSEGGTIRYITPAPSLTRYSEYARGEVSSTENGDPSYNAGVAVGGPIVQDKLGFRASVWDGHTGGYLDRIDPNNPSRTTRENTNYSNTRLFRGAVTWAPTENTRATLAYFTSHSRTNDATFGYQLPVKDAIVAGPVCYNYTASGPNGVVSQQNPVLFPQDVPCNSGTISYTRPGYTYGPYTQLGENKQLDVSGVQGAKTNIRIPSLTLEYNFDTMSVKSITSYIEDNTKSVTLDNISLDPILAANARIGSMDVPRGLFFLGPVYPFPELGQGNGHFFGVNRRHGISQEFRFASSGEGKPFSWVGGVFYSNTHGSSVYEMYYDLNRQSLASLGLTSLQRFGSEAFVTSAGVRNGFDHKDQQLNDVEIAAFGEGNYWVTDKLKLTAGVRMSRVEYKFHQSFYGPINGFLTPTLANGGLAEGQITESPVTPKFGAQYQITDRDMVYVSASKGFRAGGVNTLLPAAICGPALSMHGLTSTDIPSTYSSDTVWNYEGGAKLRLLGNRVQLNGSAYRIDWKNVQLTQSPGAGCGITFTANAGSARSQGVELEAQALLFPGLTANLAFGYDNAEYTANAQVGGQRAGTTPLIVAVKGEKIPVSPYTVELGARYDHRLSSQTNIYGRVDYRFAAKLKNVSTQNFALADYSPDTTYSNSNNVNLRLGVEYGAFDINVFANNVLSSNAGTVTGGRSGCFTESCGPNQFFLYNPFFTNTPYNLPRQIGLQIAYRH